MAMQMLKIFLVSLSAASGARVRPQDAPAAPSLPEDWAEKTQYVCMQKWKDSSKKFEDKFCLVKYDNSLSGDTVHYADDIEECARGQEMKLCDMKEEEGAMRVSYSSYKVRGTVAKSCFRMPTKAYAMAMIEAAVKKSTCEEMKGGEIGEAVTTTTTPTTTTTEEVPPEPEIDEEAEKVKTVDALSLFSAEGYWEWGGKQIKCCVSSAGGPTYMQDINADVLPDAGKIRVMGDKKGCGYMFGNKYHSGLKPHGERTEDTCVASVGEIMKAADLDLAGVLKLELPEVVSPEPEAEEIDDTLEEEHY